MNNQNPENYNNVPTEKENDFEKEHFYILNENLEYYSKSKSKKSRYKYRTLPLDLAS